MKNLLIALLILITSCSRNKSNSHVALKDSIEYSKEHLTIIKERNLLENKVTRLFSNPVSPDTLSISIVGNSITEGQMIFTIKDSNGKILLEENHPSVYLIGYGIEHDASSEDQENYIRKRVLEFFDDTNFTAPAIALNDEYDSDYSDKDFWDAIKSDRTAIGFYYLIAEENGCRIAYSKRHARIVTFFCCC